MWPGSPTLAGFIAFTSEVMGINALYLPPDSPIIGISFNTALAVVNHALRRAPAGAIGMPTPYAWAVYNLAGSTLIYSAQDQEGRSYFRDKRTELGINKFEPGVVASASDVSTSTSLLNPEFMKKLTMRDLQTVKDPFGRVYMMIAQAYGPTVWGLS